jgi:hypothetical protein
MIEVLSGNQAADLLAECAKRAAANAPGWPAPTSIAGRWIVVCHADAFRTGTVVDQADGRPRRVRIQHGPMQGKVLEPEDYTVKCWLDQDSW